MVSLLTPFRSIRWRLFSIVIITLIALLYQVTVVPSAIGNADDLEQDGNDYLEMDRQILVDLTNLREMILRINAGQIDSFIYEILYDGTLDVVKNIDDANLFVTSEKNLNELIDARAKHLYEITPTGALSLTSTIIGEAETNIGGKGSPLMNTNNSGSLGAQAMMILFDVSLRGVGNQIVVGEYVNALDNARRSNNYQELDFNLISPIVENIPDLGLLDLSKAIYNATLTRLNNLNSTTFVNKTDYIIIYELLFDLIAQYFTTLADFSAIISSVDLTLPYSSEIEHRLIETNVTIVDINSQIRSLATNNLTQTNSEIEDTAIGLTGSDVFLTPSQNYTVYEFSALSKATTDTFFLNLHNGFRNNIFVLGKFLPQISYTVNLNVGRLTEIITRETAAFELEFDRLLKVFQNNIDTVQLASQIILTLATLITALTAFQLISNFSSTQKKYDQMKSGDLKIKPKKKYSKNELGDIDRGFDSMVTEIRRILTAIHESSERMAGISEELAAGSEEASASVQDVASTVREFSSGASEQNLLLNRVEEKLAEHLKAIEETSTRINETSTFVLKVAKRTNILGLNASIEAAKAGKFGRGFSIVAREVRNLSNETKRSAVEIAELIEGIETRIRNTVREIQHEVNITKDVAENTAAGSEEASASTSEQVIMLSEISQTSNELSLLASELAEIVNQFQV